MDVNFQDDKGNTILHEAVGNISIMRLLLDAGSDPSIKNKNQDTPLEIAFHKDLPNSAALLVRYGADLNSLEKRCVGVVNYRRRCELRARIGKIRQLLKQESY